MENSANNFSNNIDIYPSISSVVMNVLGEIWLATYKPMSISRYFFFSSIGLCDYTMSKYDKELEREQLDADILGGYSPEDFIVSVYEYLNEDYEIVKSWHFNPIERDVENSSVADEISEFLLNQDDDYVVVDLLPSGYYINGNNDRKSATGICMENLFNYWVDNFSFRNVLVVLETLAKRRKEITLNVVWYDSSDYSSRCVCRMLKQVGVNNVRLIHINDKNNRSNNYENLDVEPIDLVSWVKSVSVENCEVNVDHGNFNIDFKRLKNDHKLNVLCYALDKSLCEMWKSIKLFYGDNAKMMMENCINGWNTRLLRLRDIVENELKMWGNDDSISYLMKTESPGKKLPQYQIAYLINYGILLCIKGCLLYNEEKDYKSLEGEKNKLICEYFGIDGGREGFDIVIGVGEKEIKDEGKEVTEDELTEDDKQDIKDFEDAFEIAKKEDIWKKVITDASKNALKEKLIKEKLFIECIKSARWSAEEKGINKGKVTCVKLLGYLESIGWVKYPPKKKKSICKEIGGYENVYKICNNAKTESFETGLKSKILSICKGIRKE